MTTIVGAGIGNGSVYSFFSGAGYQFNSPIFYTALTPTNFTLLREDAALLVNGVGFTYTDLGNGTSYAVGGTITGLGFARGGSSQGWAGFNVSITDALTAVANHDELGFDNLFFGGDDTFNWTDVSGSNTAPILYGFGGNDVFNIGDMDANGGGRYHIDGGTGNDTLNLTGGVGAGYSISGLDLGSGNSSNFHITNVETVKLGAGSNYTILAQNDIVTSGNTLTVDGSALGAGNQLVFNTNGGGGYTAITGNLVLLGGAGNDVFEGGTGSNIFSGGGGNNTVSFQWTEQNIAHTQGVTADLSIAGTQNFGPGWGSGSFTNIQNLIGTRWNDVLIGNSGDNILTVGSSLSSSNFGDDVLIGGGGNDTAVVLGAKSSYTITTAGGTTMLVSSQGTVTLTGIEHVQFDDQTISLSNAGVTVSHAPTITTGNFSATGNQTIALSSLFAISNPATEAITKYELWDSTRDSNSGYFMVAGVRQAAGTIIDVTAAQLVQTVFVTGRISDSLQIRALNAMGWSAADNVAWAPFTVSVPQDQAPVVIPHNVTVVQGRAIALSDLVSVTDPDGGTVQSYQLWDGTADAASGYWVVGGVAQSAGTIITVAPSDIWGTYFQTGSVGDRLQVRVSDGILWSAGDTDPWAPVTVSILPDHAPVVTTHDTAKRPGTSIALSSFISYSDPDNDAISGFQLWDSTSDPASGHWVVNGVAQPANTIITLNASDANNTYFVFGSVADNLQVRATDGTLWSAAYNAPWAPFTASPGGDTPPVVTTSNMILSPGTDEPPSFMYQVSDADNDGITKFQFWVDTRDPNAGYFTLSAVGQPGQTGTRQPAGTTIELDSSQLYRLQFIAGSVATQVEIRAFDGTAWSAPDNAPWSPFTVLPRTDLAPVVTTTNQNLTAGASVALSNLFSVSDADGDTITKYESQDTTSNPASGYITVNNVLQVAGSVIDITAAQLTQTDFVAGRVNDTVNIRAFDGVIWSAWAPVTISVPANHAPVVATSNKTYAAGATVALSSLFNVTDADSDTMTKYELWDSTRDPNAGHFVVNGVVQPAATIIDITAGQLASTSFVMGTVMTGLQIRAFDGVDWSAGDNASWSPFVVSPRVNNPPVATTSNKSATPGQVQALSSLVSVTDADGDTITKYQLWDGTRDPNSGHFSINGLAQAAGTVIEITAAQAAQTSFVAGRVNDNLQIRAFDGATWSAADTAPWSPFTVSVPVNHAPVVTTSNKSELHGVTLALSSLFTVSDADGDTMTRYQLWDATRDDNSGHFVVNGIVQAAGTVIDVTAAQLPQTSFVAGGVGDSLQIRAFDGVDWSAGDNDAWAPFTVSVAPNSAPVVTTANLNRTAGQTLTLSSLFSVSDADGDAITKYELWDSTGDPNSGHFVVNGTPQAASTIIDITASQLSQTTFVTDTIGDNLQIRAFDGYVWSAGDTAAWAPFHISV